MSARFELPPALVISLDFELHWGVRDKHPIGDSYTPNLMGARAVVPRILELFAEFDVAATWATVGFLFARSRDELERFSPSRKPAYVDRALSPYEETLGTSEIDDPLHFAPGIIEQIRRTPRQEIGTHTFSHYYCGEPGQTIDSFADDIAAARAIADGGGLTLRSIVFPRNQHNPMYDGVLAENGIRAYRGNPTARMWRFATAEESTDRWKRAARILDTYFGSAGRGTVGWNEVMQPSGLSDVRASAFLRPHLSALRYLEPLRLARIRRSIRFAGRTRRIFHLWWHPHNFGVHQDRNLTFLRGVLNEYAECRRRFGMQSMSMRDVDEALRHVQPARASAGDAPPACTEFEPRVMS